MGRENRRHVGRSGASQLKPNAPKKIRQPKRGHKPAKTHAWNFGYMVPEPRALTPREKQNFGK